MTRSRWNAAFFAGALCASPSAFAQQAEYLDDRSSADALVRSLYNAVSRKEYARAWDYFGAEKPAKDFKAFVQGYEKTKEVVVETGPASEEGAAGSVFYQVPVAIRATDSDDSEKTFAGCFTARLTQPANQEPPFQPLHLEKGTLRPAEGELSEVLPASCGDGPAPAERDKLRETVEAAFKATYGTSCDTLAPDAQQGAARPEIHDLTYRNLGQAEEDPDRKARLFRFACGGGAYNTNEIYYLADDFGDFRQLQFAVPELDIRYEHDDSEGKVESVSIIGYRTSDRLVNSFYDDGTKTLQSFAKWRGIGDASSSGTYLFRDGEFSLIKYDVDASYDEEINPESVLDFQTPP